MKHGNPDRPNKSEKEVADVAWKIARRLEELAYKKGRLISIGMDPQTYYGDYGNPSRLITVRLTTTKTIVLGIERETEPGKPAWTVGYSHYENHRSTGDEGNIAVRASNLILPKILEILHVGT